MNRGASGAESIRRVAIVAKIGPEEGGRVVGDVGDWLARRGIEVLHDSETASILGRDNGFERGTLPSDVDLVLTVGGDGTLLSVARTAAPLGVPILGINFGSLGFLTELQPDEALEGLAAVLDGNYSVEERQTLRVRLLRDGNVAGEYALLNDAVITKSALARMIVVEVRIDDERVATYTSDGLIVSTPTGSTAYNLSAGGPILDPRMRAFVIAPICPHTMTYRPLVVPGSVVVRLDLHSTDEAVYTTLDGQIGFPFENDDCLRIDEHSNPARLVRVAGHAFFAVLRRKLRWGER